MASPFTLERYPKTDIAMARKSCLVVLREDITPIAPLSERCVLSIVIPAYDEHVSRIKAQVKAFNEQTINAELCELVYVVNNGKRAGVSPEVLKKNDAVLAYLKKAKSNMRIVVLDRSSAGHELAVGNVGHARNYGVNVVAHRYLLQNRDGILLQSDADTLPTKKTFLRTMLKDYIKTGCIGASGGVRFILSMDSMNAKDRHFFKAHLPQFNMFAQWGYLIRALHSKNPQLAVTPTRFSGANMSSLAVAAICAGGVPPLPKAVDVVFGNQLEDYAKKRHALILPRRDQWIMKTSFRESTRTGSGFGPLFSTMRKNNGYPLVAPIDAPPFDPFLKKMLRVQKKKNTLLQAFAKAGMTLTDEEAKIVSTFKPTSKRPKRLAFEKLVHRLFRLKYPLVPLSTANYKKLKALVNKKPKQRAYAENSIKYFATFYLN